MSEWLLQLQNPEARKRKMAIAALAKAKNTSALGMLEQVSRHDPDEGIREYAAQAIRYIQKQAVPLNLEPAFLHDHFFSEDKRPAQQARTSSKWITDLAAYVLINIIGSILLCVVSLPRFASGLQAYLSTVPYDALNSSGVQAMRFASGVLQTQPGALVVVGIIFGLFSLLLSLLTFRLIHLVATHIFSGASTFNGMLRETMMPQAQVSAVLYGVYLLASLANPMMFFAPGSDPFAFVITLIVFIILVIAFIWLGDMLGNVYSFGTQKGCLSLVITFFLYGLGGFALGLFFGSR